ncbi:hypothetical protein PHLCEN_2v5196 [Hermanssonia centrifuga]|uniref:UBX domain-containing protein n=1 Tax=Hermanssonia centrifuga TaxID=98765 RepID=A0A2R6P8U9_9APHY|nr:hypothetical protein PHLCEN_2v5196 [Hermanssonia centrifuga]
MSASARTSFTRVDMTAGQDEESNNEQEEGEGQRVESSEEVQAEAESVVPQTPQVSLTFLTVSGRRRSMSFDPEITIGRAKELVWNAWPNGEYNNDSDGMTTVLYTHYPTYPILQSQQSINITYPSYRVARRTTASAVVPPNSVSGKDTARRGYPHQ